MVPVDACDTESTLYAIREIRGVWAIASLVFASALVCPALRAEPSPSVPDFSGPWARNSVDFETPAFGPGPVVNLSHRPNGARDHNRLVGDYTNPILRPWAAEVVKEHGELSMAGVIYPTPTNQCWPESPPFILWQLEMQILQERDRITILYHHDHQVRHIRLNEPHTTHAIPSWSGDSVAHYEGDGLVIDTIGIKVAPLSMIDQYGTPHTKALHVVERYRLIDGEAARQITERDERENDRAPPAATGVFIDSDYKGKGLQIQFTVEDAGAFTMPWSAAVTYRRARGDIWDEHVCAENRHEYYSGRDTAVPTADKPDF
jgi:hypothetical protein